MINVIRGQLQALAARCGTLDALLANLPPGELRELPDPVILEAAAVLVRLEALGRKLDKVRADTEELHAMLGNPLFDRAQGDGPRASGRPSRRGRRAQE